MIANLGLMFLFGITISSGQFMPRLNQQFEIAIIPRGHSNGCPSGPELAPLICKFMQQSIDLQYKPKLIAPTTYIPPLVVEKSDSPKLEMKIDLPGFIDEKKAVVIPAPPELPPITIPKFPVPVIIEVPPASMNDPCKTADIPETPVVNIPIAPELPPFEMPALPQIIEQPELQIHEKVYPEIEYNVVEYEPWVVPQAPKHLEDQPEPVITVPEYLEPMAPVPAAPELPAFVMPEFPVRVGELGLPAVPAPSPEDESIPELPTSAFIQPLDPIPAAPELPPALQLPEFPLHVEIPAGPVLPPADIYTTSLFIEQPDEEPWLNEVVVPEIDNNYIEYNPISVPQPPKLPAFVMPELPKIVVEQEPPVMAAPYPEDQPAPVVTIPEYIQPLAPVPAAPELRLASLPEFPMMPIVIAPCPEDESFAEIPVPELVKPLAPVPAAPELPSVQLPNFPVRVEIPAEPILPPVDIFSTPMFIEQPLEEPCLNEFVIPEIYNDLVVVPQPPELPAFVMPELPEIVMEQELPIMTVPYLEDQPEPVITVPEYLEPMAPVPAAPELPAFVMPEFPVRVGELGLPAVPAPSPEDESIPELPTSAFIQPLDPIPAAPELPPALQLPEFPLHVETPAGSVLPPADIYTTSLFIEQPVEEPWLNEVVVPEIDNNYIEYNPISVPQPPKLPAFVMPELPKIVVEQEPPVMAAPYPEDQPAPVVTIPKYIQPLAPVPAAPELRLASLPEFPIHLEIPSGPVLMPNTEEPCLTEELLAPKPEPIIIPQPPKLPKLVMPELPKFETVALPMPAFAAEPWESSGQPILKITAGPGPYFERYFPSSMENLHKIMIPSQPIEPGFFPTRCVYDLVIQHVIPNIASDRFRSMDSVKALPSPVLPCS